MISKLFTTLLLEYSNPYLGSPFYTGPTEGGKNSAQKYQNDRTRQDKPYGERLSLISLPSLSYKRLRDDLSPTYYTRSLAITSTLISLIYIHFHLQPGATNLNY